ncbi:acyl carrier protein [Nannocystis pusilla]|uniref:acyl carrier protein n=1 Tax=Nannocystis pusilla TaxID=889268 RepID=UPI003B7A81E7
MCARAHGENSRRYLDRSGGVAAPYPWLRSRDPRISGLPQQERYACYHASDDHDRRSRTPDKAGCGFDESPCRDHRPEQQSLCTGRKSLLGVQLLNDIKHEFGVTITPEEASPSQTLGDLASLVSRKLAESPGA